MFRECCVLLKYLKDSLVQALQLAREREDCEKKKWRKWKENTKSILRGWRQIPHHRQVGKKGAKNRQHETGFSKREREGHCVLVRPTTDECAKALVHFVGSCSRLARSLYQERCHQVGSALRWGVRCQYKLLRGQRQMAHQSVTENDKNDLPGFSLIARGTDRSKVLCTYPTLSRTCGGFFLPTHSQFIAICSCAYIGI